MVPAADLRIGPTFDMPAGMICRAGHPLLAQYPDGVPFKALRSWPVASIPLSEEVARILVARYGAMADPGELTTLQCEEIPSLLQTVQQTDAIYLGILGAARQELLRGELVQLSVLPRLDAGAVLGMVTLAGRTEPPVMRVFRDFVVRMLGQSDGSGPELAS